MSIEKIKELHSNADNLNEFEREFISNNYERIKKYGEKTKFSEKQIALVNKIHQERIVDGKAAIRLSGAE